MKLKLFMYFSNFFPSQEMSRLEDDILKNEKHKKSNCFVMVIICHGNNRGQLKDVNKRKAWDTEELIGDLSKVETLVGKPKIMILQCCRGGLCFLDNLCILIFPRFH